MINENMPNESEIINMCNNADIKAIENCYKYLYENNYMNKDGFDFILNTTDVFKKTTLTNLIPNDNLSRMIFGTWDDFITEVEIDIDDLARKYLLSILSKAKRKSKKTKQTTIKKDFASCPTSLVSAELHKQHKSQNINLSENSVVSDTKDIKAGTISITKKLESKLDPFTMDDSKILSEYNSLGFEREDLQIYLALLNIYIQNTRKKDYGKSFEIDINYFHNEILCRKNRLRESDIKRYEKILDRIASTRITYTSDGASVKPFDKKDFKNIVIKDNLIYLAIIRDKEYKHLKIKITPSTYTLLEIKSIKQISNYLPWDFLQLGFDESDNIFYFGLYIIRLHRNNESAIITNEKGKKERIKNVTFAWEIDLKKLVIKALPNGEELIKKYENEKNEKKKLIQRHIEKPLGEAIGYFEKCNYIIPQKDTRININYRNAFQENKIKFIFNYDNGKLISLE